MTSVMLWLFAPVSKKVLIIVFISVLYQSLKLQHCDNPACICFDTSVPPHFHQKSSHCQSFVSIWSQVSIYVEQLFQFFTDVLFVLLLWSVPSVLHCAEQTGGDLQRRSPVHCCCNLRISACSPFNVLAWSCCRKSRFFWALCSWFSRVTFADAIADDVQDTSLAASTEKKNNNKKLVHFGLW